MTALSLNDSSPSPAPARKTPELVVLSGKGGTGKTTVVAALASIVSGAVLADCDVDAADLSLVLRVDQTSRETFQFGSTARILTDRCSGCGECAVRCRFEAISALETTRGLLYQVDELSCEGCALCLHVCTCHAVEMTEVKRGEWFVSETHRGPLVHARLGVGGENSGRLVTQVREQARAIAQARGSELVLIDGPPGIGCPAIASVTGADFALLVTEPTVSAAHDLGRVAELVRGFDVPLAVCLNKCDVNAELAAAIERDCTEHGLPIVGRLAYDPGAVRAQIAGQSVVEHGAPTAAQVEQMWNVISDMLRSRDT